MADIKQAARWMQESKPVKRAPWFKSTALETAPSTDDCVWQTENGAAHIVPQLRVADLLADDWEIAPEGD